MKPQAGSLNIERIFTSVKPFKQVLLIFFTDANALIGNFNTDGIIINSGSYFDRFVFSAEFNSITHQIDQDVFE